MVVPTVGVIVQDDHRRALPRRLLLQEVDQRNQEGLLVQRIGVSGMAVLKGLRLDEAYRREIARLNGTLEVL